MNSNHQWLYMQLLVSTVCCIYGREEKLLFSTANQLKEIALDTGVVKNLATYSTSVVHSLAYDVKGQYVYVPRYYEHVIERFPYPNDQTLNFEIVVSTINPYYVAFDSENSHLYWTGNVIGKIMRCNPNGSDVTTIVDVSSPRALTLDTHNRWIYYSTQNSIALHKVTFDGKANQVVVNLTSWPIDIEIDFVDRRIYCMEFDTGDLKSALYNGSDVNTVVRTNVLGKNREIDISADYVFYTSYESILKVHKSSGQIPTVVHTETSNIYGLLFYKQESIMKPQEDTNDLKEAYWEVVSDVNKQQDPRDTSKFQKRTKKQTTDYLPTQYIKDIKVETTENC